MYKSILFKIIFLVSFVAFISCDKDGKIEYIPFKSSSDGKWGLVGTDGKLLFEEEFKEQPTFAMNGRFMVHADKGWEVYTAEKNPKLVGSGYYKIADFTADVTPAVKKKGKICLVNKDCEEVVKLDKVGKNSIVSCSRFKKGLAVIKIDDDKEGVINTSGVVIVNPKYDGIFIVSNNTIIAMTAKSNIYKLSFFDGHGEKKSEMDIGEGKKYEDINPYASTDDYLAVRTNDDEWGYIDYKGNVVVKPSSRIERIGTPYSYYFINGLESVRNDMFIYSDGSKYGVMDFKGNSVIKAKYNRLFWANDDALIAYRDDWQLVNLKGEKIIDDADEMFSFDGKHVMIKKDSHDYSFLKMNGKKIDDVPDIYYIDDIEDCLACDEVRLYDFDYYY